MLGKGERVKMIKNYQPIGWRGLITVFTCILLLLAWSPLKAQAGPGSDESVGAYIELHVAYAPAGAWTVVQWQDSAGNWHNIDGWQTSLVTGNNIRWWVAPKDFGSGPFRWAVTEGPGGCLLAMSSPFTLPDEANEILRITVSLPGFAPSAQPTAITTEDKALQMAVFEELWNTVNTNYLYEDFNGVCWETLGQMVEVQINEGMTNEAFWAAMSDLIESLNDGHSDFLTPVEADEEDAIARGIPDYTGVGFWYINLAEEGLLVLYVFPNSPAEHAGIKPHDRLIAANGVPACCDEAGNLYDLHSIIRGPLEGTDVTLTIRTPGESPRDVVVIRARILDGFRSEWRRLEGDIGYILVPTLRDENIAESTEAAWRNLNADGALNGLILDLRTNTGGWRTQSRGILALFTDGVLGEYRSRNGVEILEISGRNVAGSQEVPLVVLVSELTSCGAEVLAGTLQEAGRAKIVGSPTDGNVKGRRSYGLDDGSRLKIAEEIFVAPSGANWEKTSIIPDIEVVQDWGEFAIDEDDLALMTAVELLNSD